VVKSLVKTRAAPCQQEARGPRARTVFIARWVSTALLAAGGARIVAGVLDGSLALPLHDLPVYLGAATRLREGDPLYVTALPGESFRYSPWVAFAFVPLTFLPLPLVAAAWSAVLVACSLYVIRPFISKWGWPGLTLFGPALLWATYTGNLHPIALASLAFGLSRRSGPIWVGLAASVKITPVLFVLWYVGRGQWRSAGVAIAVATLLWAPILAFDLSGYATDPSQTLSLLGVSGPLWLSVAAAASAWALAAARGRHGLLWAAVAVLAAQPRLLWYDLSYLALAASDHQDLPRSSELRLDSRRAQDDGPHSTGGRPA
jgi:hypothetical protein